MIPTTQDANQLLLALFRPATVAVPLPLEQELAHQAVINAGRRWPLLAGMVQDAANLVAGDALYTIPGAPPEAVALCKPAGDWQPRLIRATPTGFGCTCHRWPPKVRAGPGDGRYCPDILAYLLMVYLRWPLSPLPYAPETLWQLALNELRQEMLRATFDLWLRDTAVVVAASSPTLLTIAVRDGRAQEWLARQLQPVILRAVRGIAGYRIDVRYVAAGQE
jgi:hypothetical protein